MKRFIICLAALLCFLPTNKTSAQVGKRLEQNATINALCNKTFGIGAEYSIGCNIDDIFFVGGGIGVGTWIDNNNKYFTDFWFPIFLQLKSTFLPYNNIRPYISLSAGLDAATTGVIINPNVGIALKATRSTKLYIGIGYSAYTIDYAYDIQSIKGFISTHIGISF